MAPKNKKEVEQEEAFEGQRIEEADSRDASGGHPGKCPTCGRDKANS